MIFVLYVSEKLKESFSTEEWQNHCTKTVAQWKKNIAFEEGIKYGSDTSIWIAKKPLKSWAMF